MSDKIGSYTLRIMRIEEPNAVNLKAWDDENQDVIDNIGEALSQAEDAVNDQLPDGFYCKIDDA